MPVSLVFLKYFARVFESVMGKQKEYFGLGNNLKFLGGGDVLPLPSQITQEVNTTYKLCDFGQASVSSYVIQRQCSDHTISSELI